MNPKSKSDDPYIDPVELRMANERHDKQCHHVTMWQRARYKGGFGYPPDNEKKRKLPWQETFGH